MKGITLAALAALAACSALAARAAEKPAAPLSAAERAKLLAAETPEQKKLRAELKAAGGRIYFAAKGQIWVVGLDGEPAKQITRYDGAGLTYPHVSPDGRKLIAQEWPGRNQKGRFKPEDFLVKKLDERYPAKERDMGGRVTILMNVDGSDPKPLCEQWDAHWSPCGRFIAGCINMKDRRKSRPLDVIDLEKLEERVVSPDDWPRHRSRGFSAYSPDGRWLCSGNPAFVAVPLDASGVKMADGKKPVTIVRSSGCNQEVSPDGKWFIWTVDTYGEAGGWIYCAAFEPGSGGPAKPLKAKLGWEDRSVNYDSCFSPCSGYMVYMHGECVKGKKSYDGVPSEIYACRFPPDGVNARLTFLNAAARHPHWVSEPKESPAGAAAQR